MYDLLLFFCSKITTVHTVNQEILAEILFGILEIEVYLAQLNLVTKHKHITVSLYIGLNLSKQNKLSHRYMQW